MVTALALGPPAHAQLYGEWLADNLRTGCQPIGLRVYTWHDDESLEDRLRTAAESRLRAARLLDESTQAPVQWLVVGVGEGGFEGDPPIFSTLAVMLHRGIDDTGYGRKGPVIVWAKHAYVNFGGTVSQVSEIVDRFLVEYLRANPEC